jgi:hypothetical protein
MKLNFILTKMQGAVERDQEKFSQSYSALTDDTMVWCMIDLVNSSNYRLLKGPQLGYIRGETFFSLIRNVISSNNQIRLIKEIGDAVLLGSDSLRPLLEGVILINQIAQNIKSTSPDEIYPFEIRSGFSFGIAKKLIRPSEDFLGSSIDQLARIMVIRSSTSNTLIQEEAYQHFEDILKEYNSFLTVSETRRIMPKESKKMIKGYFLQRIIC